MEVDVVECLVGSDPNTFYGTYHNPRWEDGIEIGGYGRIPLYHFLVTRDIHHRNKAGICALPTHRTDLTAPHQPGGHHELGMKDRSYYRKMLRTGTHLSYHARRRNNAHTGPDTIGTTFIDGDVIISPARFAHNHFAYLKLKTTRKERVGIIPRGGISGVLLLQTGYQAVEFEVFLSQILVNVPQVRVLPNGVGYGQDFGHVVVGRIEVRSAPIGIALDDQPETEYFQQDEKNEVTVPGKELDELEHTL